MVLDTKESVNVLEGQEIKLELNGKTVTGVRDYTIENSGELIIVEGSNVTLDGETLLDEANTELETIRNELSQISSNLVVLN